MLEKGHKEIVLPVSGTKLTVRKLGPYDYTYTGHIPDSFAEWTIRQKQAQAQGKALDAQVQDFKPAEIEYMAKCVERCIVKVHQAKPQDAPVRIVAKQPGECGPYEFSFFDLTSGDVDFLLVAVFNDGEAAEVPAAFFPPKE